MAGGGGWGGEAGGQNITQYIGPPLDFDRIS